MRQVKVNLLTTNNLQISGILTITTPQGSYRSNISDLLNNSRNFISLTDVEVHDQRQQLLAKMPLLCVNKPTISLLFEEESKSIPFPVASGL